jgi:hypothetical protein
MILLILFAIVYVRRLIGLTKTILSQKAVILERADNNLEEIADQTPTDLQPELEEELVVDCPDCFDTMIKIYDSDKARYQCENCDLAIGECGWL